MQIDYLAIVVVSVCAITFYRAGEHERSWGSLWAALSIMISFLVIGFLRLGIMGILLGQLGLFFGITIYRMFRKN